MEKIGILLAFASLPTSLFFSVAKFTGGSGPFKFAFRFIGLLSSVLAIVYILKYFNLI